MQAKANILVHNVATTDHFYGGEGWPTAVVTRVEVGEYPFSKMCFITCRFLFPVIKIYMHAPRGIMEFFSITISWSFVHGNEKLTLS